MLQAKLLEKAIPDLKPEDKIRAVILLSNGLDLPFSMHLIQGAAARSKNNLAIGIYQIPNYVASNQPQDNNSGLY